MKYTKIINESGVGDDNVKVEFKCTKSAVPVLAKLLRCLEFLGNIGASRTLTLDDSQLKKDGIDTKFGFDGDGSDGITDITFDGKDIKNILGEK